MNKKLFLIGFLFFALLSLGAGQYKEVDHLDISYGIPTQGGTAYVGDNVYIGAIHENTNSYHTVKKAHLNSSNKLNALDSWQVNSGGSTYSNLMAEGNANVDNFVLSKMEPSPSHTLKYYDNSTNTVEWEKTLNSKDTNHFGSSAELLDNGSVFWYVPKANDASKSTLYLYDSNGNLENSWQFNDWSYSSRMIYSESNNKIFVANSAAYNVFEDDQVRGGSSSRLIDLDTGTINNYAPDNNDGFGYYPEENYVYSINYTDASLACLYGFDVSTGNTGIDTSTCGSDYDLTNDFYPHNLRIIRNSNQNDHLVVPVGGQATGTTDKWYTTEEISPDGLFGGGLVSQSPEDNFVRKGEEGGYTYVRNRDYNAWISTPASGPHGFVLNVEDSPPKINDISTNPSTVNDGDTVDILATVSSASDTISSVEADVYKDNTIQNSSLQLTNTFNDNWEFTDAFTAQDANYQIQINGTDSQGRSTTQWYNFTAINNPPSISTTLKPQPLLGGDDLSIESDVTDPEGDAINSVTYDVLEGGSSVASGSMSNTGGSTYEANNVYNLNTLNDYTVEVTAEDSQGNSNTNTKTFTAGDLPTFNYDQPNNQSTIISDTALDVTFSYGATTQEDGDIALYVNGNFEDSTANVQGSNTEGSSVVNLPSPSTNDWHLEFSSTSTDNTYVSDRTSTFYIKSAKVPIESLDAPSAGETFNVPFGGTVDIDHNFTINAEGVSDNYEYYFELTDSNNNIEANSTATKSGGTTQSFSESVSNIGQGDYTYYVETRNATDGTTFDSASKTYSVEEPDLFNITYDNISDGDTFTYGPSESSTDVSVKYTVEPNTEDVTATLYLDGNQQSQDSVTTSDGSTSFTETLSNLNAGTYTLNLDGQDAQGNTKNKTISFNVEQTDVYSLNIDDPNQGETFNTPLNASTLDITSNHTVDLKDEDVSVDVLLDGSVVGTQSYGSNEYNTQQSFSTTLNSVSEGSHTLKLEGNDSLGNVKTDSISFDVNPDDEPPQFTETRVSPSISDANVGDDMNVYFEAIKGSDEIDYVTVDVLVNGSEYRTYNFSKSELNEGSVWLSFKALEFTSDLAGSNVDIEFDVFDTAQRKAESLLSGVLGDNREPSVELNNPYDGEVFEETAGTREDIEFNFDVTTANNPVEYQLNAGCSNDSVRALVATGDVNQTDTTTTISEFAKSDAYCSYQFTDMEWTVELFEYNDGTFEQTTVNEFTIKEQDNKPEVSLRNPGPNDVIYTATENNESADVPIDYEIKDSPESGTVTTYVEGRQVAQEDVTSGTNLGGTVQNLAIGTYDATINFESNNFDINTTNTFAVERFNETEPNNPYIQLRDPRDGKEVYQNPSVGQEFAWKVYANESYSTNLVIEDSGNNVVENYTRNRIKNEQELAVFRNLSNTDYALGDYTFYAEYRSDSQTLTSNTRSFTVVDSDEPTYTLRSPNDAAILQEANSINFDFAVESFDDPADVKLKIRNLDNYNTQTLLQDNQSAFTSKNYTQTANRNAGTYEWFVEGDTGDVSTTSKKYQFTVEAAQDISDPNISLINPKQDEKYTSDPANVSFEYSAEVDGVTNSTVRLQLQNVSNNGDFQTIKSDNQVSGDGNVTYNEFKELEEAGYRYRAQVVKADGSVYNSSQKSFAVGDAEVPSPTETPSVFDAAASFVGDLNDSLKQALGSDGQFIFATILVVLLGSAIHLLVESDILTMFTLVLASLSFSIIDGYYPIAVFYVTVALAAGVFAWLGRNALGGGS